MHDVTDGHNMQAPISPMAPGEPLCSGNAPNTCMYPASQLYKRHHDASLTETGVHLRQLATSMLPTCTDQKLLRLGAAAIQQSAHLGNYSISKSFQNHSNDGIINRTVTAVLINQIHMPQCHSD